MSSLLQVFFLIFIMNVQRSLSQWDQDSCRSPNGVTRTCINIRQCPTLLNILQYGSLFPSIVEFLQGSRCGSEGKDPKVCCIQQSWPDTNHRNNSNNGSNKNNKNDNEHIFSREELLPQNCGRDLSLRILGGERANIDEFPWMVLLEYQKPTGVGTGCGGVLISNRYVLTAAHCIKGNALPKSWRLTSVRLGEYNTETDIDCVADSETSEICAPPPVTIRIAEIVIHEDYDPLSVGSWNDIALLRLSKSIVFSDYIQPICLPQTDQLPARFWVAGWGRTEHAGSSSVKLKLSMPLADRDACQSRYRSRSVNLASTQICVGGQRGKDTCRGDSGGPLMSIERSADGTNRWTVVGVVSFGPLPCGLEGWPAVYTKVTPFSDWILRNMRP